MPFEGITGEMNHVMHEGMKSWKNQPTDTILGAEPNADGIALRKT